MTAAAPVFSDWTSSGGGRADGALAGAPVVLTGTTVYAPPASILNGSSAAFSSALFTPPLAASDELQFAGNNTYAYTIGFGTAARNPVLHLGNLASELTFPPGTSITRLSGESTFTVAGSTVRGTLFGESSLTDSNGSVRLNGTFTSVSFTTAPTYGGGADDGIQLQVGADDIVPPDTAITAGPREGTVVGDVPPAWQFAASEPGARFECRTYDPADAKADKAFRPCSSPHQRTDLIRRIALGERSIFEVRAIDASGNADPSPAVRRYTKHGKLGQGPPKPVRCKPITIASVSGRGVVPGCRLARIKRGKVPCVHITKLKRRNCRYTKRSGRLVRQAKTKRRFAIAGEAVSLKGKKGGAYVVAVPTARGKKLMTTACAAAKGKLASIADTAGPMSGTPLIGLGCTPEKLLASHNASGFPLENFATREVCTSSFPHPDGAPLVRQPEPGVYCYKGKGAALNDPTGRERDADNRYLADSHHCHLAVLNPTTSLVVGKRPATINSPLRVNPKSALVWRPVVNGITIANDGRGYRR